MSNFKKQLHRTRLWIRIFISGRNYSLGLSKKQQIRMGLQGYALAWALTFICGFFLESDALNNSFAVAIVLLTDGFK